MKLAHAEKEVERMMQAAMPVAPHERFAAMCRPREQRTPFPSAGQAVHYRHDPWGALSEATVEQVDTSNQSDQFVWRHVLDPVGGAPVKVDGRWLMEMIEDPWPDVYLLTRWGRIVTREARIEGSPGWLVKP